MSFFPDTLPGVGRGRFVFAASIPLEFQDDNRREPARWMAGSDSFKRTAPFGGPVETEAAAQPVHVAIAYHADGTVAGYRDGKPYGKPYKSDGPVTFAAGKAKVTQFSGTFEAACEIRGDRILLRAPREQDNLQLTRRNPTTLDADGIGEIHKK